MSVKSGLVCPNESDPVWKYMVKKIGEVGARNIFDNNNFEIPQTEEEADIFINEFKSADSVIDSISQKERVEDLVQKIENPKIELEKMGRFYVRKDTGEVVSKRISDRVQSYYRSITSFRDAPGSQNLFYAKKGTVIHEYKRYLVDSISSGIKPNIEDARKEVRKLKNLDLFSGEDDSFFNVSEAQFDVLLKASKELVAGINKMQETIDKDGEAKIFTEVTVYSEQKDVGGTIDVLVVFSDGSVSIYDYKTFSKKPGLAPTPTKIKAWDIQMAGYRQILRNDYGVTNFRHQRVIPINVSFSKRDKNANKFINNIAEGFQRLATYTSENNLNYLKPIPFDERTEDDKLNNLIDKIEKRISQIDENISVEKNFLKKSSLRAERARLYEVLKRLQRDLDVELLFTYITSKASYIKDQINLSKSKDSSFVLTGDDILSFISEMEMFDTIYSDLKDQVDSEKSEDERKKLLSKLRATNTIITETLNTLNSEVIDNVTSNLGDDIGDPGEIEGYFAKNFDGINERTAPVFAKLNEMVTYAKRMSYLKSKKQIEKLYELDKSFSDWAEKNGYGKTEKFKLLLNDKKQLVSQYVDDFYKRFGQIKRDAFSKKGVSSDDIKFLNENFVFDKDLYMSEYYEPLKSEIEKKKKLGLLNEEEYNKSIKELEEGNASVVKEKRYRGYAVKYFKPKDGIKEYQNRAWLKIQENKPVKDYYDFLVSINESATSVLGKDVIGSRFIPNVKQTLIETMIQGGAGLHGVKNLWNNIKRSFSNTESDDLYGQAVDGRSIKSVPVYFTNEITIEPTEEEKNTIRNEVAKILQKGTNEYKDEVRRRINERRYELGNQAKTIDLTSSYSMFISSFNNYMEISTIEPMVRSIKYLMNTRGQNSGFFKEKISNRYGFASKKPFKEEVQIKDISSETINDFSSFADKLIYGQSYEFEIMSKFFGKYGVSANRIIRTLMQLLSLKTISLDFVLGSTQAVQVITNMLMLGAENRYFSKKNIRSALRMRTKNDEGFANVVELFNSTGRDKLSDMARHRRANNISKIFTLRNAYYFQSKPTEAVEDIISVSMSQRYVVDSDGRIKNPSSKLNPPKDKNAKTVYESVKVRDDGSLYIPGVDEKEINRFRNKMLQQIKDATGNLTEEQKGLVHRNIIFDAVMQFRSWIPALFALRFRGIKYDSVMEEIEVGRLNVLFYTIFSNGLIPAIKNLTRFAFNGLLLGRYGGKKDAKYYKKKFDDWLDENPKFRERYSNETLEEMFNKLTEDKIKGAVSEIRTWIALALIVNAARGLGWDDEEESNIFAWNIYRVLERSLLESGFWLRPKSVNEVIRQPVPLTQLVTDMNRFGRSVLREISFEIKGERDPRVKTDPYYYFVKNVPIVNQVYDTFNFFEPYQIEKTGFDMIFDSIWRN